MMRKKQLPQIPTALACGLLEDRQRALFLVKLDNAGMERLEIPCVEIMPGDNPVSALTTAFRTQTGIDAQVHEILFQKRHNVGSNKRKVWIPALVFKITAKSTVARPSSEFSGYRWLEAESLSGKKLSRKSEWLRLG